MTGLPTSVQTTEGEGEGTPLTLQITTGSLKVKKNCQSAN